jgi:hypothetical protein
MLAEDEVEESVSDGAGASAGGGGGGANVPKKATVLASPAVGVSLKCVLCAFVLN